MRKDCVHIPWRHQCKAQPAFSESQLANTKVSRRSSGQKAQPGHVPRLSLGICEEEGCPLGRGEPSLAGDRLVPTRVLRSLTSAARDPRVSLGHQRAGPKDGITAPPISIFLFQISEGQKRALARLRRVARLLARLRRARRWGIGDGGRQH